MSKLYMTSRERMLAAMTRQMPDHVPLSLYISHGAWYESPTFFRNQFERATVILDLELDPTIDIWLPWPQLSPDVLIKTWRDTSGKEPLLTVARRTIVGDAFQWFCDIPQFMMWMIEEPEFVKEFLGIWQEWSLGVTKLAVEAGVDVVQRRGWYESPTF